MSGENQGPDLYFAGGECLTRHGVWVRRTDMDLEAATREVQTRNDQGVAMGRDGILRPWKIDTARTEWLSENEVDRRNVLNASNNFASAVWVNARSDDSTSAIPGPFPDTTTTKLFADLTAANTHYIFQQFVKQAQAIPFVFSIFVRAQEFNTCEILISDATLGDRIEATFQFPVGGVATATVVTANNSWIPGVATVTKFPVDWIRLTISGISDALTVIRPNVFLSNGLTATFDGDGVSGFNIYGGQLDVAQGEIVTAYQETPTDPDREFPSLLLEEAGTNEVVFSEDFSGVNWVKNRLSVAVDVQIAPDDFVTADRITEDASNDSHLAQQATDVLGDNVVTTCSVYARAAERRWLKLTLVRKDGAGVSGFFDVGAGDDGGKLGTIEPGVTGRIRRVGNDYFRCSIAADVLSGGTAPVFQIFMAVDDNVASYQGDGASSMFWWGAQVDQQIAALSYLKTGGTNVQRATDIMQTPFPHPPQEQTLYIKFQERGTLGAALGIFGIQDQNRGNPRLELFSSGGVRYALQHTNQSATTNSSGNPSNLFVGDIVELVGILRSDGSVQLNDAVNGGDEQFGARSITPAVPLSPNWSDRLVWLNSVGSGANGVTALLSVKIQRGVRTLEFMRAL